MKIIKKSLAIVLAFALLVSAVINCMPVFAEGLDEDATSVEYNFGTHEGYVAFASDFDIYSTETGEARLSKGNYADYVVEQTQYNRIAIPNRGEEYGGAYWVDEANRILNFVNNKGIYDEFELVVGGAYTQNGFDYADWAIPQIFFGRQDDKSYKDVNMGYALGMIMNTGNPAEVAKPMYMQWYDSTQNKVVSYQHENCFPPHNGCAAGCQYTYTVKVADGKISYTMESDWSTPYTEVFDLPADYKPGSIGFRIYDTNNFVSYVKVTGTPLTDTRVKEEEPEEKPEGQTSVRFEYSNLSDTDVQEELVKDTAVYRGESVSSTHSLEPTGFNNYFEFENGYLKRNGGIWGFDSLYLTFSNQRTNMFFKAGKFDDFEISFDSYSTDQFGYSIPIIHFGVKDPTKFATGAAGYAAQVNFWPNGGAGRHVILKYNSDGTSTELGADVAAGVNDGFNSNIYGYTYTLKVKDGVATFTTVHVWPNLVETHTVENVDLGDAYSGGYVGIGFIDGDSCFLNNLKINGNVIDNTKLVAPEARSYPTFTTSAAQNSFKADFNVFRSEAAASTHKLEPVSFADYFSFNDNGYLVRNGGIKGFDDLYPTYDNRRTNLIYKNCQFKDFELSFYSESNDQFGYGIPIICFGVKDPTKFATGAAGYTAQVNFWPNGGAGRHVIMKYNSDGTSTELGADVAAGVNDGFNSNLYGYTYTLKVKDGVATFTTVHVWPNLVETHTVEDVDLGDAYTGGYIGISLIDADSIFIKNLSLKGISLEDSGYVEPGEDPAGEDDGYVVTPGVYDHFQSKSSRTALKNDFTVYTANDDKCASNGFVKADFYEDFDFSEEFLKRVSSEPVTFYGYFDSLYTKSARLMYNKGKFNEFKISIDCVADSGDGANSWEVPSILFGVQDPALYAEKGSGYSAGTIFNPVSYGSYANIAGYSSVDGTKFGSLEPANQNNFSGASYRFEYVLEVKNGKVYYTYNKPDWNVSYTYSIDLPADYVPGAVGFQFADVNCIIYNIKISGTPIENSVIDPNDDITPAFADKTSVALNGDNFTLYTGGTSGRTATAFGNKFTANQDNSVTYSNFSSSGFKFGKNDASYTDTLIYKAKQFENFEASVTYKSTKTEIGVPIVFGVTNTNAYKNGRGTGFTLNVNAEKIGDDYFVSPNVDGSQVAHGYNKAATTGDKVWGGHDTLNTLTLRVVNSIATITVESEGETVYCRTLDLWNTYLGGYVGLGFLPNEVTVYDFSIADLGNRDVVTVACVGDSITYGDGTEGGFGKVRDYTNYPLYLQEKLGNGYYVVNYGVCGATVSSTVGNSYRATGFVEESKAINPDVVLLMLGYNDAWNWGVGAPSGVDAKTHFKNEYRTIIAGYVNDLPDARIIIATPAFAHGDTTGPDSPTNTAKNMPNVVSAVKELAEEFGLEVVDINEATSQNPEWFEDSVHPNSSGYKVLASEFAKCFITPGDADGDGEITETDVNYARNVLLGCRGYEEISALDMNDDGRVDVRDFVTMKILSKK